MSASLYRTVREEVAIYLREMILKGDIKQGDRIKEADIADELGISRGPVREAFRQLEQEGLITYTSRRGCSVRIISAEDAYELYMLRATLENLAVELCKGKYSQESIQELKRIVAEMDNYSKTNDLVNIVDCDQRFHTIIVDEAKKARLFEMWSTLDNANVIIYYALYKTRYTPGDKLAHNHMIVVDALEKGDVDSIKKIISEHYMIVSENLYKTELNNETANR